jgi:hypothetical protein
VAISISFPVRIGTLHLNPSAVGAMLLANAIDRGCGKRTNTSKAIEVERDCNAGVVRDSRLVAVFGTILL